MERVVRLALHFVGFVIILAVVILAAGLFAYSQLDIEAYPNPVAPMIEIITQANGWSAEEIERYVTIPIEAQMSGMLDLEHIRSQSLFGLSDVKCYFNWDPSYYLAQQRVLNRLSSLQLPNDLSPQLSPWSAIGEVFRYRVIGEGYTLDELKSAEDWILERQFKQVPGVIDVVSFGGYTREYHVEVDPFRLRGAGTTLPDVLDAVSRSNANVGGGRLQIGEQSFDVRGTGLIRSLRDIGEIVVTEKHGVPVRIKDLAQTLTGASPRLGIVGKDVDPDIVQGTVLMRYGGNSLETLKGIHARVDYIRANHIMPPGMDIVPYYDRASLVRVTTHTVLENLLVGMILVSLVLWVFLGHLKAALITALNIPLALMVAFIGMVSTGTPANLISLGAVDFGIVVDSTVIMMENVFRHLGAAKGGTRLERITAAAAEVGAPMFSSTLIIGVAFIPLFTMTGVAGVIFAPMAHTYAFAIGGAILLALTLTPVLCFRFLHLEAPAAGDHSDPHADEHGPSNAVMRFLDRVYKPLFAFATTRRKAAIMIACIPVAIAAVITPLLGREFMPHLEEGNFWIRATLPVSINLEQTAKYVGRIRSIVLGCPLEGNCEMSKRGNPEIETVISQIGRPDDGTDPVGFYNVEIFAPLAQHDNWRKGVTKELLTEQLSDQLEAEFPGVVFNFSQMIADNVEEAMSGVKGENSVKVIGLNLETDEAKANDILHVMADVHGVEDLGIFRTLGQPSVRISPDRIQAGRYGLNVGDIEAIVEAAIGGRAVTQVYEGERHYDLTVRWAPQFRSDIATIRDIPVPTPDGASIPLAQVAKIEEEEGASLIYREDLQRYVPIKFSVRGRDLASTIAEVQKKIDQNVKLPYDVHLDWAGEMDQLNEATGRLAIVVPMVLALIVFLVHSTVKRWRDTLIVIAGIPVACAGGIIALALTRINLSISAFMGFISIFGIATQDALIVVTYAQKLWREGLSIEEGARVAAERRLRPVLMTTSVAMIGLLPAAVSHGIGSETQKPLAVVVIGGALILAVLPRLLQPALLVIAHKGDKRARTAPSPELQRAS